MRRLIRNADDLTSARRHRETFVDKPATKKRRTRWEWPKEMEWIGYCEAVMYASDKWKRAGNYEDYKHVAEGEQYVLVSPGFVRDYNSPRTPLDLDSEPFTLPKMPEAFAELAEIFGVQVRTFDDEYLQIDIARAKLGGASNKELGTFLFVYTGAGVHMLIAGPKLKIEKDGITG